MKRKPIHVNVPYPILKDRAASLIEHKLNPEIYFSGNILDILKKEDLTTICSEIRKAGLSFTFHAPFMDLSPGSPDRKIRAVFSERMDQIMDLAEAVVPDIIVVHGAYDRWRFDGHMDMWLKNSLDVWPVIVRRAARLRIRLAMENVFDNDPEAIDRLLSAIDSPNFGHCFDIGHFRLFSKVTMEEWFRRMGKRMIEVHIHDNNGERDEHLPPGEGNVNFDEFFALLRENAPDAIYTIEPHEEGHLRKNLEILPRYLEGPNP